MSGIDRIKKQFIEDEYKKNTSILKQVFAGSIYKVSDLRSNSDVDTIRSKINVMRALAKDSQVATALSYYATDATTPNSAGEIIWATNVVDDDNPGNEKDEPAALINTLFKRWNVNEYARDHILELATIGNLYIPTTDMKKPYGGHGSKVYVGLDQHMIEDYDYDIIPSHKIPPEQVWHLWREFEPYGYIYDPNAQAQDTYSYDSKRCGIDYEILPESSIIHFTLGGLVGDYTMSAQEGTGEEVEYDIQFATPLLESAVQPTQTLNLLEDATVLSSLLRVVRFVCLECNSVDEDETMETLTQIKSMIEQQMSINTSSGDAQSYLNPQSPNNIIYLPKVNGADPVSIIDMNMRDETEATNDLLEYYQNKKLSVLGIPKEAMNFSSAEGLGGAGAVMSQRSALYANALQRIMTAYKSGWKSAIDNYFIYRNLPQYVGKYELHMNPILTEMSTIQFEKRDAALGQALQVVELLKSVANFDEKDYRTAISEILVEAFPKTSSSVATWSMDIESASEEDMGY